MDAVVSMQKPRMAVYRTTLYRPDKNPKIYVGKQTFTRRWQWNRYLGSGVVFAKALAKYGRKNAEKELVRTCNSVEELNSEETRFIKLFNATDPAIGYNISAGGGGPKGMKHSEESKEKMRAAQLARIAQGLVHGHPCSKRSAELISKTKSANSYKENRLSKIRSERNIGGSDFANLLGITESKLSKLAVGKHRVSASMAESFANKLGLPIEFICSGFGEVGRTRRGIPLKGRKKLESQIRLMSATKFSRSYKHNRLSKIRLEMGMTSKDFSFMLGIKQKTFYGYDRGYHRVGMKLAERICSVLNMRVEDVFWGLGEI